MKKHLIMLLSLSGALFTTVNAGQAPLKLNYGQAAHIYSDKHALVPVDGHIMQMRSLSQGSVGADYSLRGSSCGYHALRNGAYVAQALLNKEEADSWLARLSSSEDADYLLGNASSLLRMPIIKKRFSLTARRAVKKLLEEALQQQDLLRNHVCFKDERDLIKNALEWLDLAAVKNPEILTHGLRYRISKEDVYQALVSKIKQAEKGSRDLEKNFDTYLGDFTIDFTIDFKGNCFNTDNRSKILAHNVSEPQGEWLRTEEVIDLVEMQKEEGILRDIPQLLVTTYGDNLGGSDTHAYVSDTFAQLYTTLRKTKDDCVGVVLVYQSRCASYTEKAQSFIRKSATWLWSFIASAKEKSFQKEALELQSSQDGGHWVTMVVCRIKGDVRYYLLDSLGNANLSNDQRIRDVIRVLEGRKNLPGLEWTLQQIAAQNKISMQMKSVAKAHSNTGTKLVIGAAVTGFLAYLLYKECNRKKDKAAA